MQADLAETFRRIQQSGADGFYRGRTAELIEQEMQRGHGLITRVKNSRLYRLTTKGFKAMWPAVRFRRIDFPTAFRAAHAA